MLSDPSTGVRLVPVRAADAALMRELLVRNWTFLEPWMPRRDPSWFDLAARRADLENDAAEHAAGTGYHFAIAVDGLVVGRLDLSNVVRRVWRNAMLGYWVAQDRCGKGFATAAVRIAAAHAFGPGGLHRVQAAVMPSNAASLRVLAKAGFRREGLAERYLYINDRWEDHVLLATTVEEWPPPAQPAV